MDRLEHQNFEDTELICTMVLNMWLCPQIVHRDDLFQLPNSLWGEKTESQRKEGTCPLHAVSQ